MSRQTLWALLTVIVFAGALLSGLFVQGDAAKTLVAFLIAGVAIAPFVALGATVYLFLVWLSDPRRPRSWLLLIDVVKAAIVTLAAMFLGYLAVIRLMPSGSFSLAPETVGLVAAIAVLELTFVPTLKVAVIWRLRREHSAVVDEVVADDLSQSTLIELREQARATRMLLRILIVLIVVDLALLALHVAAAVSEL